MRSLCAGVVATLVLAATPASAAIRINDSFFENGMLTVTGQAPPHQKVTLDGKYTTSADGGGHFEFHVRYKPDTCMTDIDSGEDSYSAVITGCLLGDAAASSDDAAKTTANDH